MMTKRVIKECEVLVRVREYETIKFRSSGEWAIEYQNEEERISAERKCWQEVVTDLKTAMTEWSGNIRHGASDATTQFLDNSQGVVSARVNEK